MATTLATAKGFESPNDGVSNRPRIDGWKAIASHLDKGVRTVQRWELELDLPVHRLAARSCSRVWAWPDELTAWLAAQEPQLLTPALHGVGTSSADHLMINGPVAAVGIAKALVAAEPPRSRGRIWLAFKSAAFGLTSRLF
jgi:hypothetical protein